VIHIAATVNGQQVELDSPTDRLLVEMIRDELALTGTKIGCGTGDCGACTVLIDGSPVTACLVYAAECGGRAIETVEHVALTPLGKSVVASFVGAGAVQCGICTPGFVVAAVHLLATTTGPLDRAMLEVGLAGNLCRCTGYYPIIRALEALSNKPRADVPRSR
jgi:carbon-monoxide dehydrogenase small subunit